MSKNSLQTLAQELRGGNSNECRAASERIKIELDEEMQFLFLKLKEKLGRNLSNKEVIKRILQEIFEQKFPQKKLKKIVKSVTGDKFDKEEKRYINITAREEVTSRSQGKCEYPNCNNPATDFHHTEPFAISKSHLSLRHLCPVHHQYAHNGLIENQRQNPSQWKLRLNNNLTLVDQLYRKYRQEALL